MAPVAGQDLSSTVPTQMAWGGIAVLAIAVGALMDGVPEALVIGLSLLGGGQIGLGVVAGAVHDGGLVLGDDDLAGLAEQLVDRYLD